MLNWSILTVMFKVFLLLMFPLSQSDYLVQASNRSGKAKSSVLNEVLKEQASNQISVDEEQKPKSEEDQAYYLPSQTVFGSTETLVELRGVSSTSPPHLTIKPAPIQTMHQESTDSFVINEHYSQLQPSQCVSETPVTELESRFLVPSRDDIKESVIMSGHLEVASKTSSVEEASDVTNIVSKPSIALQGTVLHSHSIADVPQSTVMYCIASREPIVQKEFLSHSPAFK